MAVEFLELSGGSSGSGITIKEYPINVVSTTILGLRNTKKVTIDNLLNDIETIGVKNIIEIALLGTLEIDGMKLTNYYKFVGGGVVSGIGYKFIYSDSNIKLLTDTGEIPTDAYPMITYITLDSINSQPNPELELRTTSTDTVNEFDLYTFKVILKY